MAVLNLGLAMIGLPENAQKIIGLTKTISPLASLDDRVNKSLRAKIVLTSRRPSNRTLTPVVGSFSFDK